MNSDQIISPSLNFLTWNCNSLSDIKIRQLETYLATVEIQIHVIALLETRPVVEILSQLKKLRSKSYTLYQYSCPGRPIIPVDFPAADDRAGLGGGICVLIHNSLFARELSEYHFAGQLPAPDLSQSHSSDLVWFDLDYGDQPLRIGIGYFHSLNSGEGANELLNNISMATSDHRGPVLLAGDFNLHHEAWDNREFGNNQTITNSNNFFRFTEANGLTILNTIHSSTRFQPTYFSTKNTGTVLDLALTNQPALVTGFEILDNSILQSDHRPFSLK
jgi:hypothetical protein